MSVEIYSAVAVAFYGIGVLCQWLRIQGRAIRQPVVWLLAMAGAIAQTFSIYYIIHPDAGINLNFYAVGSLCCWLVTLILLLSSLRKPVENLFVIVLPMAILAILTSTFLPARPALLSNRTSGMVAHVLVSVLAYSMLTVAAIQAVLLAYQENHIKQHRHSNSIIRAFPPMQTMEKLLFEFLWVGLILLTFSLASGFLYLHDAFAQHVAHKTILSVLAWILFVILLAGRRALGWRGQTATRWTLSGFAFLMLAFFGSKFVMDLMIN